MKAYYVDILGNASGTLYTGVTNDIIRRLQEHKNRKFRGFTKKYRADRLLFFEEFENIGDALNSEKQIKGWLRKKKKDLIRSINPNFSDLSKDWESE